MSDGKELLDDGLTDEERLALAEDEGADDATDELKDDQDETKDESNDDAGNDAAGADDQGADETNKDDEQEEEQVNNLPGAPLLVAEAPEDAAAQLESISTKKEELITQFDDGDITAKEYQQQLDALSKQEREIERAVDKAQIAAEMEKQRKYNEWVSTVNGFLDTNKVYKDNPRLYRALDQEVKDVAATPEAANWDGNQILKKAHENLTEAFGLNKAAPAADGKPGKTKPNLPPNLAKVPAADTNDMGAGKYAALDRLAAENPIAYEEHLAKMPDAERDAYLAS